MEKLKSGKNKIDYKCIESVGCDRIPKGWDLVASVKTDLRHNCLNHAKAIHEALNHVEAGSIALVDADTCIMYKGWDNILLSNINRYDVWGTAFGNNSLQYHKFPNVFFFAFKRAVLKMVDLDFYPKLRVGVESPVRYKIENKREANFFHKDAGEIIKCDTGWRLPLICGKMGLRSGYMSRVLGGDKQSCLPFADDIQRRKCLEKPEHMAEWHYKGKLYITHKQASRNHPLDGEWGKIWHDRINLYFKNEYGFVL
jgi:hypothetical protein